MSEELNALAFLRTHEACLTVLPLIPNKKSAKIGIIVAREQKTGCHLAVVGSAVHYESPPTASTASP